jgi:hypothetical protein
MTTIALLPVTGEIWDSRKAAAYGPLITTLCKPCTLG